MKYFFIAAVMFLAGILLSWMDVGQDSFVPTVRFRTPEGFFITAIQASTPSRKRCNKAIEQFVKPIEEKCENCFVESKGCQTTLYGIERALASGERLPIHTVS